MIPQAPRLMLALLTCGLLTGFAAAAESESSPLLTRGNGEARVRLELVGRRVRSGSGSIARLKVWGPRQAAKPLRVLTLRQGQETNVPVPYGEANQVATATIRLARVTATDVVVEYLQLDESYTLN